jgi:hypothetical protein
LGRFVLLRSASVRTEHQVGAMVGSGESSLLKLRGTQRDKVFSDVTYATRGFCFCSPSVAETVHERSEAVMRFGR